MQGFNHVAGGLAFTGIFASFADVNIFEKPEYIGATVFFSLLADIDHTKSPIGKLFWPIARWLDRNWGHRTITHCLPFFLAVVAMVALIEQVLNGGRVLTGITALAYGSHLIFDMCTRQGIPLFMPFTRARCVLPGNPNMRLSNRAPLAEVAVFFGFCLLILTTMPLMAAGFWNTVNNEFATFRHVLREQNRKADVLMLTTKEGHTGQVVAVTETSAIIWSGGQFMRLSEQMHHPEKFSHTGKPRRIERLEFVAIDADSLRKILAQPVVSLVASSGLAVRYRVAGQQFEQPSMKLDYPANFDFQEVKPDNTTTLATIERLRATVSAAVGVQWRFDQEQKRKNARIKELGGKYEQLSAYEQGKATDEIAKLRAELAAATAPIPSTDVQLATAEITRLKTSLAGQKNTFTGVATIWKP